MKKAKVIPALAIDARLKRKLRHHLAKLGFYHLEDGTLAPPSAEKSIVRTMHSRQRASRLENSKNFIIDNLDAFERVVASGSEIDPSRIELCLKRIDADTLDSDLFRMAALTWSVPVSNGFGRRLRYLVWDNYHGRLAGIIALGDPVFNLGIRDKLIGWNAKNRCDRLTNVLDAYVLGALPPYNLLMIGKVVACLVRTKEIYDDFLTKYGATKGVISGKKKRSRLLLVTTSSSLGRSSLYNRLKLDDQIYFKSVGYTEGWGHFHIPDDVFSDLRDFLSQSGHPYVKGNRFGQGPNWRLRTIREGLKALGLSESTLHHGLKREVFVCEFASNSIPILKYGRGIPLISELRSVRDVASLGIQRWVLPRAVRRPEFRHWQKKELIMKLTNENNKDLRGMANAHRTSV